MEGKIFFAFGASQVIFTYGVYRTCHLLILFTLIYMYMYVCVCVVHFSVEMDISPPLLTYTAS